MEETEMTETAAATIETAADGNGKEGNCKGNYQEP
jgi:hypothetical protein